MVIRYFIFDPVRKKILSPSGRVRTYNLMEIFESLASELGISDDVGRILYCAYYRRLHRVVFIFQSSDKVWELAIYATSDPAEAEFLFASVQKISAERISKTI